MRSRFGHPKRPHEFFDEFTYVSQQIDLAGGNLAHWNIAALGGGILKDPAENFVAISTSTGGAINLVCKAGVVQGVQMDTRPMWNIGAAPLAIASFRFWIAAGGMNFSLGFTHVSGLQWCWANYSNVTGNLTTECRGIGGVSGTVQLLGPLVFGTLYTVRIAVMTDSRAFFQLDTGAWVEGRPQAADTWASNRYTLDMQAVNAVGAESKLGVDQAYASDGELSSDMV